jgi:hypothetical protein
MPEFGILQAVVLVLLLILMFAATTRIAKLWREEAEAERMFKTMRSWWFWGDALLRGWIRALPAGVAGGWLLAASMMLAALLATETVPRAGFMALALLVVGVFVCLAVVGSVMLVNRPPFAVPPHLRTQQGALAEWRTTRRRRRKAT